MTRTRTRVARTMTRIRAAAAAVAAACLVPAVPAPGQCPTVPPGTPPCSSGCQALVVQQSLHCIDGLANENGIEVSTSAVFAHHCAAWPLTGQGFHVSHASHFTPPVTPFVFTHLCIGVNGAAIGSTWTQPSSVVVQLFAGPSTSDPDSGTPLGMFFGSYQVAGNRILVPVGTKTVSAGFWVVVSYNNVPPQAHRQLVAGRSGGRAMLRLSGTGVLGCQPPAGDWWDYDAVGTLSQGTVFCGSAPIVRPVRLANSPGGTAAFLATPAGGLTTSESGLIGTFTLRLSGPPTFGTTLRVTTSDATEGVLRNSSGALVNTLTVGPFTSLNFNQPRTVQIAGVDDALVDGDRNYTLDVTFENGDPQYAAVTIQVAAVNRDNDSPSSAPQRHWSTIPVAGPPAARRLYALAHDDARGELVLFGGRNVFGQTFGDTWTYRNNQWTLRASGGPSPRWSPAMAYDSIRQVIVLFGGYAPVSGAYNDSWEWDGQGWTQTFSGISTPGTRGDHAMVHDAGRQRMVMYGGRNGATGPVYQETWELLTTPTYGWALRSASSPPGQRTGHGLAYDVDLGLTYLFGGYFGGGQLGGTYAWNGTAWTLVSSSGPSERTQHAMAFDRLRRRTVVQGGFDGPAMFSDTWEWDGAGWTQLASASGPQRAMHEMTSSANGLLMVGGINAGNVDQNDLWSMNGNVVTRHYHIQGSGSGTTFQLGVTGSGWGSVTPGIIAPPGSSAATVASIMSSSLSGLAGVAGASPLPAAPHVIGISYIGSPGVFSGITGASPPVAIIQPSPPVPINPIVREVYLTGVDCNGNGLDDAIDVLDDPALDADGNGAIDSCEPPPPPPPCLGDLDGDMIVGISDLLALLAGWGECDGACAGDLDGDFDVGIGDLLAILSAWGGCDKGGGGSDG